MYTNYFSVNQTLPKPFNTISCMHVWFDRGESWPWGSAWISKTWKVLTKNSAFCYLRARNESVCKHRLFQNGVCYSPNVFWIVCYIFVFISAYLVNVFSLHVFSIQHFHKLQTSQFSREPVCCFRCWWEQWDIIVL